MVFNRYALAEFLRLQGITKAQLAARAAISPGYITELVKGDKRTPSIPTVKKLAEALDVDWRALCYESPAREEAAVA